MANKLTQEQIDECKEVFDLFDGDEDGYIAADDLVTALRSLGQNFTDAEARRVTEDAKEASGGGAVDFTSFLGLAARKVGDRASEKELVEALGVFDDGQSGSIPAEQLRQVMATHGDRLTEEEADEMVRKAGASGDERIDYRELAKVLATDQVRP